jgi:hypothetical protein
MNKFTLSGENVRPPFTKKGFGIKTRTTFGTLSLVTLLQQEVNNYSHTLITAHLQPAVYIIYCVCDDGNTYPIKWVKQ